MPHSPSVLICLANGNEAIEVVTFISLLTRAGIKVTLASAQMDGALEISGTEGIPLHADVALAKVVDSECDLLLLPGGSEGCRQFAASLLIEEAIRHYRATGRYVAAMSEVPAQLLSRLPEFQGANLTCLPALADQLPKQQWQERRVVWDARFNLITGQGPLCATDLSLKIIELLKNSASAHAVTPPLALPIGIYNYQDW